MPGNEYGGNNSTSPKCGKWSIFANQVTYAVYVFSLAMRMHDVYFTADLEEHYQEFLKRKEARENALQDVQAELHGLIADVKSHNATMKKLSEQERKATSIIQTYPDKVTALQNKIHSAKQLFIP